MCGRFEVLGWDEVADVVRVLEAVSPVNVMPDWPARLVGVRARCQRCCPGSLVTWLLPIRSGSFPLRV